MKNTIGFTLIELLVAIAIVAMLATIAYPSYRAYLINARRGEAKTELIKAQLKQTSLHILNPSYSDDESKLGLTNSNYYSFLVASASNTTYSIQAIAKGTQAEDAGCGTLSVDQDSNFTPIDCW